MKIKDVKEYNKCINNRFTGIVEDSDGERFLSAVIFRHLENGSIHQEDGAAVVLVNGHKAWYLNNKHFDSEEKWKIEVERLQKNGKNFFK
jgi:hypothetical protein